MPAVKPHIAALAAYMPPWSGLDRRHYLRLDLGECTQAPPQHVAQAVFQAVQEGIQRYPDYNNFMPKLAEYSAVAASCVLPCNGSDQAISLIVRAFLSAGDSVLMAQPGFPIFMQAAALQNAKVISVPYQAHDLAFPLEAFVAAISAEVNLIVLINPNNPTGTPMSLAQIETVLQHAGDIPVIVDEAYYEFTHVTAVPLLARYPNLIITRTFSKAFAMAGLRLGYIIASPELIQEFAKIRPPFDVNSAALAAACAQLEHPSHWQAYIHEVMHVSKPMVENFFHEYEVFFYPGAAHFMLVKPKDRDAMVAHLKRQGILVFPMRAPAIKDTFRMSVGTAEETRSFIEAWRFF
jgi:histidinol-phosphate aminotransferase